MTKQRGIGSGFGARSTAEEVVRGVDLAGRTVLVTGGYSGLGLETTRALSAAGAHVVVPARRPAVAEQALRGVPRTETHALDLGDLESVRLFCERFLDTGRALDVIIAGAGVMACPETRVGPGWEAHFAINHLGHFALVNRLRPALSPGARVVSVASSGHFLSGIRWDDPQFDRGYDRWLAYAQSKTANALFAVHLDALGASGGVHAFALHPGSILTPLQRHVPRDEQIAQGWMTADGAPAAGFKTPEQGAATAVWAATSPLLEARGGVYCQDCDVAEPATTDDMLVGGVKPWAVDPEQAARLWTFSSELTGLDTFA
ncbi:NAD(P)-dependent dehydrogenase, short-chain alcohol dehydrogenase family [Streptoalloteichus hindustanus]|uniref:Probable oxidoreductase n=2 Tax=Streptoalloteichus hindustanus TaxID=2017 RepID=A0A1M5DIG0_STRHI|nr:SDR family NAD(P)-dependent oxidoreductase [Streptoalloteichus hindustanus]SHF66760.1 NAD(P)-dependent dehydrogenase, short-chain alcohol dehydrogenase family [Streptoalloteichus hindustanus]